MTHCFTVPGEPKGKARPRYSQKNGRMYTPRETQRYEELIRQCAVRSCLPCADKGVPVAVWVTAVLGIPKSDSKVKQRMKLCGDIQPLKKPDADNILKAVLDALNGVAYEDDTQVVRAEVSKIYGLYPHLLVDVHTSLDIHKY